MRPTGGVTTPLGQCWASQARRNARKRDGRRIAVQGQRHGVYYAPGKLKSGASEEKARAIDEQRLGAASSEALGRGQL